ncbi:hypothetical protein OG21DRAFT_1490583 [Imleria badia]|nr:hypothetical protein OG21DRAFT_1490583 [Imleria badia]
MAIPIYRHNQNHDDWEVASVYDSDDSDSLGRSACEESLHSDSLDNPALHMQGHLYDDTRPHVRYSVPESHQNYTPAVVARPQRDARYAPGKQSSFVVPPPGVIFPCKDWSPPPQNMYWPPAPGQIAHSSDRPVNAGLVEPPSPSLLLSPSSPPRAPSPLIRRPSPATSIAHGQPPHAMSMTVSGTSAGTYVNTHASPMMPPPPRYHELAHTIPPRLAEAGCQAHHSMAMIQSPRRSGHDALSSPYAPGPGHASMLRGPQLSEEMTLVDGRYNGGGYPSYGPGDRPELRPPPGKYEYDPRRPQPRERRPSIWRRFVRRFNPSHVSVGQT